LGSVAILEINGKNYKHGQGSKKRTSEDRSSKVGYWSIIGTVN
jgi:hypothetical protein